MWIGYSRYIPSKSRIVQIVVAKPACITGVQRIAEFTLAEAIPRKALARLVICQHSGISNVSGVNNSNVLTFDLKS